MGLGLFLPLLCVPAPQGYTITDLGNLSSNPAHESLAAGINNRGHMAGESEIPAPPFFRARHAFWWDGHVLTDIPPIVPNLGFGNDLNDGDQVVGYSSAGFAQIHAYLWEGGTTTDIHVGTESFSRANGINAFGSVCGSFSVAVGGSTVTEFHPYLQHPDGSWLDLGTFGGSEAQALALNDLDQVVGYSRDSNGARRAFLWRTGQGLQDLGHLGGGDSEAWDVSNVGAVVGCSRDAGGRSRPFLWVGGVMTDLGTLGGDDGHAKAVNEFGLVVGNAQDAAGVQRAALWDPSGAIHDLNALIPAGSGWDLTGAHDVNELGEIAGTGWHHGNRRAFKLTPVLAAPRLSGPRPGMAGVENRVFGIGFVAGARVHLAASLLTGATAVPGCSGLSVGLGSPVLVGTPVADPRGRIEHALPIPARARGATMHLQAVDALRCQVSERVSQTLF